MNYFLIRLNVSGDDVAADQAVQAALDAGVLQDFIADYEHDDGPAAVTSVYLVYGARHRLAEISEPTRSVLVKLINSVAAHQSSEHDHEQHRELVKLLESWQNFARGTL